MKRRSRTRFLLEGLEGLLVLPLSALTWPVLGRRFRNWGLPREERERSWSGDALVDPIGRVSTRAIAISEPAAAIWPWIVQLGLDRAGFYSYELIERLGGLKVTNLESIGEDWQTPAVGDELRLHPTQPGLVIRELETGKRVCYGDPEPGEGDATLGLERSWSFYLEALGERSCRLIVRSCIGPSGSRNWLRPLLNAFEGALDFTMEQRMLRTIRRLAKAGGPASHIPC